MGLLSPEKFIKDYLDVDSSFLESMREQMAPFKGFDYDNLIDLMEQYAKHCVSFYYKHKFEKMEPLVMNPNQLSEPDVQQLTEEQAKSILWNLYKQLQSSAKYNMALFNADNENETAYGYFAANETKRNLLRNCVLSEISKK